MKRKFFSTIAVFFALALTACQPANNNNNNGDGEKSAEPTVSESKPVESNHKHKYGDWVVTKPAKCEEDGEQERVCECGDKQTKAIPATGHTWDAGTVTKQATCSVPGEKTFTCTACGAIKKEDIKADHVWGEATAVTGGEGEVDFNIFTCTACNTAKKIEFVARNSKATLTGGYKSDSSYPDYMKLNANGDSIEYVINSPVAGNAKIYQRGVMDYWHDGNNENQARNYYSGKSSTDGNFRLDVNGTAVDYSWSRDVTYEDMLPGEAQGSYSPLGDALIGDCAIVAGANTIKYTRTESYNMLIKDFVIIIG